MRHYKYNLFLYVVAKHKLCGSRADSVVVLFLHSLLWVSLFTQTVYSGRNKGGTEQLFLCTHRFSLITYHSYADRMKLSDLSRFVLRASFPLRGLPFPWAKTLAQNTGLEPVHRLLSYSRISNSFPYQLGLILHLSFIFL